MSPLLQNLIVILAIAFSLLFVSRQLFSSLMGKKSKLGSCCSKGCGHSTPQKDSPPKPPAQTTHFIPLESLTPRRQH